MTVLSDSHNPAMLRLLMKVIQHNVMLVVLLDIAKQARQFMEVQQEWLLQPQLQQVHLAKQKFMTTEVGLDLIRISGELNKILLCSKKQ